MEIALLLEEGNSVSSNEDDLDLLITMGKASALEEIESDSSDEDKPLYLDMQHLSESMAQRNVSDKEQTGIFQ